MGHGEAHAGHRRNADERKVERPEPTGLHRVPVLVVRVLFPHGDEGRVGGGDEDEVTEAHADARARPDEDPTSRTAHVLDAPERAEGRDGRGPEGRLRQLPQDAENGPSRATNAWKMQGTAQTT